MVTADTITDVEIKKLRDRAILENDVALLEACNEALERGHLAFIADIRAAKRVCVNALKKRGT